MARVAIAMSCVVVAFVACSSDDSGGTAGGGGKDASSDVAIESGQFPDGGVDPDASVDAGACANQAVSVGASENPRGSNSAAFTHGSYDYAPSVMHDGMYRMWWCGGVAGDHILYAEADNLDGPWHAHGSTTANSYDDVFQPTGVVGDFDGAHTCDPSVIRVNGTYYMFYGGLGLDGTPDNTTRLGVATSTDGFGWSRLFGGKPIVNPAQSLAGKPNQYGAGQPSAFFKDGLFYLSFTDTSAAGANPVNGAGQFVLRSKDPTFQSDVEELSASGFVPQPAGSLREYKFTEAFSPDWTYVPAIDRYLMVVHGAAGVEEARFFDAAFQPAESVTFAFDWHEGPGIVKRPDGQLDPGSACDRISIDVMRAVGAEDVSTWELGHSGADFPTGTTCECVPWTKVLEGTLIAATDKPLTLVRQGERLQFETTAPATRLARTSVSVSEQIFSAVPFGASMHTGATVVGADARPAAFRLDGDRLWPSSCLELITDNGSSISTISVAEYDGLPQGPSLYCLK